MWQSHRACSVCSCCGADRGAAFPTDFFSQTSHQIHGGACHYISSSDLSMHKHSQVMDHILIA